MGKIRIYDLAKELGVENRVVLQKAQEMGMRGKNSHSNSLDPDEEELLRRALIREAINKVPDLEVVKTRVDKDTGEREAIVESRKGNVIRRRRAEAVEPELPGAEPLSAEEAAEMTESGAAAGGLAAAQSEAAVAESGSVLEEVLEELLEEALDEGLEEALEGAPEEALDGESAAAGKKALGPKVLGKIELPQRRVRVVRPVVGAKVEATPVVVVEDEDEEGGRKKKRKGRRREFSRDDLVDYESRPGKRSLRSTGRTARQRDDGAGSEEVRDTRPKEAKRVVRMSGDVILVGELARQMSLKAGEVIAKLIELGVMATINQAIDQDTAVIVAGEFDFKLEFTGFDEADALKGDGGDDPEKLKSRSPVVTVMGHVDHGKTSLLDYIRKSSVAAREHGGITQHIGAYVVELEDGRRISFIDTPGHEAFTSMRARGAQVTDIVVLVVAADDGVMPQTIEAVNHAKAAGVSIVVAMNKMDRPGINTDRIKQQLAEMGLQPEEWGGDTMFLPVSALTGQGIPELLEGLLLVAEMRELKANPDRRAIGAVIESQQELGKGTVATVLVRSGTLRVGDIFVAGAEYGRVRSMTDHNGLKVEEAPPAMPVEITGFNGIPSAGDDFAVVESETVARQITNNRQEIRKLKEQLVLAGGPLSLEEFAKRAQQEQALELNVILKADVNGSLEAVRTSIEGLSREKVGVRVLHGGVGGVNESDVQLAIASRAIIIGFNVRGEPRALKEAEASGIDVRFYRIIYDLLNEVKQAMTGLLAPLKEEVHLGRAEVRDTFSVPKFGTVAGCYVQDGMIRRGAFLRLLRDARVVHEGRMQSLRRFKDDVREVQTGYECGISFDSFNDVQLGDVIEAYEFKEVQQTLD